MHENPWRSMAIARARGVVLPVWVWRLRWRASMSLHDMVLLIWAALGLAYVSVNALSLIRCVAVVPVLKQRRDPSPDRWPLVSTIVPACNEATTMEAAIRSRLADDYPAQEIVLIDDRSTDGTGAIADDLASKDERIKVRHVTQLPAGWLGKLHAMHEGTRAAKGELLLFSDADVHLGPGALRRAVAYLEAHRLDQLGVVPRLWSGPFWLDVALTAFVRFFWCAARPWAVANPRSNAAVGVGAFNLVRRTALDESPGLSHLRLEQADDMALAQMLKRSGARCGVVNGHDDVGLHFYRSLGDMAGGAEKAGARWPLPIVCAVMAIFLALEWGPWVALWAGGPGARAIGALGAALTLLVSLGAARWMGQRLGPALLPPIGAFFMTVFMLRASVLATWRGGVQWRGTFYGTADLRAGRRFRF